MGSAPLRVPSETKGEPTSKPLGCPYQYNRHSLEPFGINGLQGTMRVNTNNLFFIRVLPRPLSLTGSGIEENPDLGVGNTS